jgi:hypothetical protein
VTTDEQTPRSDADGGWKDIIEDFTEDFFRFYFPDVHAAIDFSIMPKFLDSVLREITVESESGGREADRLIEVRLKDGTVKWLLVHVEVQGYPDPTFAERMYIYNYRTFDKYHRDVISLAVLTDNDPDFRPTEYRREMFGCSQVFRFPVVKLKDLAGAGLDASDNPFALVTRMQLDHLEAGTDPQKRLAARIGLTRPLYRHGFDREQILRLYRFLGFLMRLPDDLAIEYHKEVESIEGELSMPYVTDTERLAEREGQLKGHREAVLDALEARFGEVPYTLAEAINHIDDAKRLRELHRLAILVKSLDEFAV